MSYLALTNEIHPGDYCTPSKSIKEKRQKVFQHLRGAWNITNEEILDT